MKKLTTVKPLHSAIVIALSSVPMLATPLSSFAGIREASPIGVYTGSVITYNNTTPFKAFADYGAANQGWFHTASFMTLTVGTEQDIANGKTYDLQLTMRGRGELGNKGEAAIDNPAFALWTAGAGKLNPGNAGFQHGWNPTRGPNEDAVNVDNQPDKLVVNESLRRAGVLNGHVGWIGYVNAGPSYTIINSLDPLEGSPQTESGKNVLDAVSNGALNTTSKTWLTNPSASSTTFSNNYYLQGDSMVGTTPDSASMTLIGLKAGNYLIATGGSCPTNPTPKVVCGIGSQFTFTVQPASALTDEANASYDAARQLVTIQDVQVQDQHYWIQLQWQPNNTFQLVNPEITKALKSQPAQYDLQKLTLLVPRIQVSGKYYRAVLQNIGNYTFRLDQINEVQ